MAQVRSPRLLQPLVMKLVLACDGGCLKGRAVLLLKCCPGAGCMGQLGCWYCFCAAWFVFWVELLCLGLGIGLEIILLQV
jgi:hypothetical protein